MTADMSAEVEDALLFELTVQSHHRLKKAKREFCSEVAYQIVARANDGDVTVAEIRRSFAAMGDGILSQGAWAVEYALADLERENRISGWSPDAGYVSFDCPGAWDSGLDEKRTFVNPVFLGGRS